MKTSTLALASLALLATACSEPTGGPLEDRTYTCTGLFGSPVAKTGLGSGQCSSTCACDDADWTSPTFSDDDVRALRSRVLTAPFAPLTEDPFASGAPEPAPDGTVCAVLPDASTPGGYTLETYTNSAAASAAGAAVTHSGACGLCSTLEDLAVYIELPDAVASVRECGLRDLTGSNPEQTRACIEELGFTKACSTIWTYNTAHTRSACLGPCIAQLNHPYNYEDGSLNDCLQCDEDESGPTFEAIAGRTHANSGLPSAICRPCGAVFRVTHDYAL